MGVNGWSNRFDLLANPVEFVTATSKENDEDWSNEKKTSSSYLTGDEAKKIYEGIINESSIEAKPSTCLSSKAPIDLTTCNKSKKETHKLHIFTISDLFKSAQSGDLDTVKTCVQKYKFDINSTDGYSWTPLMMAAYEGHTEVVIFLLMEGSNWTNMIDGSGYDARDLACLGGHGNISDIFTNSRSHIKRHRVEECREQTLQTIKREKIWCEICKCHYHATAEKSSKAHPHHSSTVHLFNDEKSSRPQHSHFYISGANKGYQLLQRGGWDGESGLGPDCAGKKYPVKTTLKRDRLGFGAQDNKAKPRVTHFAANDKSAVKRHYAGSKKNTADTTEHERLFNSKTKRKIILSQRDARAKVKEIDFRRMFH